MGRFAESVGGMICFVGGGVGTADYLTVKAVRILRKADVVLYSKYLDRDVLKYCKKSCVLLCFSDMARKDVDGLLLKHSRKLVVYLANGDFACYGTVQDHFDFCKKKNLRFDVVPGVSAVSASSSVLSNEMVLPNISNSLIITYMDADGNILYDQKIEDLAKHNATLAVHMIEPFMYLKLQSRLLVGGYSEDTPVIIVKEVLRKGQNIIYTTVGKMNEVIDFSWMSIVLVGWVFADEKKRMEVSKLPFVNEFRKAEHYNVLVKGHCCEQ